MGGVPKSKYGKKVFKYNVQDMTWTRMPDMTTARSLHACALFKDESASYVLVAGGFGGNIYDYRTINHYLASTEMYFLNGTVKQGKPLKEKRSNFRMIFIEEPAPRIYAIGGYDRTTLFGPGKRLNSIEMWDNSKTWKMTSIKMKTPRNTFGAVGIPKSMMPQNCQ